ncbi:MAG TPA: hypothetical protein VMF58_08045 [Rhizomicrobium sp.]|nr:hypothetical protein [Rhizomicrobium sp.]HTW71548.1 hypothetical protein [Acetobacteraceae bacterium]
MSDARWIEIEASIASAVRHFTAAAEIFDTSRSDTEDLQAYLAEMGFMHAMQAAHTSLETALLSILALYGEEPPSGAQWHADPIPRVGQAVNGRPPVLSAALGSAANETRQFRHVAARAYDDFDWERAARAVGYARRLAAELPEAISRFRGAIDP